MKKNTLLLSGLAFAAMSLASEAAVTFTASIDSFGPTNTNNNSGFAPTGTSTNGDFANNGGTVATHKYRLSNVDLTSIGGTATETIDFELDMTATGGSPAFSWGYIDVDDTGINTTESLTATIGTITTSFAGGASKIGIAFNSVSFAVFADNEATNIITEAGTVNRNGVNPDTTSFAKSSYVTIDPTNGNLAVLGYGFEVTAVPEPSSTALLGLAGLGFILRRRR